MDRSSMPLSTLLRQEQFSSDDVLRKVLLANRPDGNDILATIEDAREALLRVRNHARQQIRKQTNSAQLITRAAKQAAQVEKDLAVLKDAINGEREALNEILSHISLDDTHERHSSPNIQENQTNYKDGRLDFLKVQHRFPVISFGTTSVKSAAQIDADICLFPGLIVVVVPRLNDGSKEDHTVIDTFDVSEPKRRRITVDDAATGAGGVDVPRKFRKLAFCIKETAAGDDNKIRAYACRSEEEKIRLISELMALLDNARYLQDNLTKAAQSAAKPGNRISPSKSAASFGGGKADDSVAGSAAALLNLEQVFSSLHNNAVTLNNVPDWLRCCDADLADLVEMRQFDGAVKLLQRFRSTPQDVIESHPDNRRITRNIQRTETILIQRLLQAFLNSCSCTMFGGISESRRHADSLRALNLEYQTCTVFLQSCSSAITEALAHSLSSYNIPSPSSDSPTKPNETSSPITDGLERQSKIIFSELNRSYKNLCELGFNNNTQCMTAYLSWGQFTVCANFADDIAATLANLAAMVNLSASPLPSSLDSAVSLHQCVQHVADCIDRVVTQNARVDAFDCQLAMKQAITERMIRSGNNSMLPLLTRHCAAQLKATAENESTHWTGIKFNDKSSLAKYLDQVVRVGLPSLAKYTHAETCTVVLPKALIDVSRVMLKTLILLPRCMPACFDAQRVVDEQLSELLHIMTDYIVNNVINEYKMRPTELRELAANSIEWMRDTWIARIKSAYMQHFQTGACAACLTDGEEQLMAAMGRSY